LSVRMDNPDNIVARLAAERHGMVYRSQALDDGLTREALLRRRESGLLVPMHVGVFRHAAVPLTWVGRLHAAVLAGGAGAVASHRSAARLHGFAGIPRWRPEVTVRATDLPRARGIQFHRTNLLDPIDVVVIDGIPCTASARTFLDLGGELPFEIVHDAIEDAVIRKLVTRLQLVAVLERVGGRGRRGTAGLRASLRAELPEDLESELERRLWKLLPPGHGLIPQYEVSCIDGRRVRLDWGDPERKIAIEANGHRWHATTKRLRSDMARRRSIQASGWDHYEYGWADVMETQDDVRAELARTLSRATS
jgi:hypothetical protein